MSFVPGSSFKGQREGKNGTRRSERSDIGNLIHGKYKCLSVGLTAGDKSRLWQTGADGSGATIGIRIFSKIDGRYGLRLITLLKLDGKDVISGFEFFEGVNGVRFSHELVEGATGNQIQLDIRYHKVKPIRSEDWEGTDLLSRMSQMDKDILTSIEQFGAIYQEMKQQQQPPRLSILLKGWDRILLALQQLTITSNVNPRQFMPTTWWENTAQFRTVLQAVVKHEYEETKKGQPAFTDLLAEFEELDLFQSAGALSAMENEGRTETDIGPPNEQTEARELQERKRVNSIFQIKLRPGPNFTPPVDTDGKRIEIKVHQGQKFYLRWRTKGSNFFNERVCAVSAEDEYIVETSTNILFSMVTAFPRDQVPCQQNILFSVAGRHDRTTYQRLKAALKAIDTTPNSSPAARIHRTVLFGEPSRPIKLNKMSEQLHHEVLQKILDESQLEAAEIALSHDFTAIQGPPGTGKTTTITALTEAFIRSNIAYQENLEYSKPKTHILITAPSNAAVNHLARKWQKRVEDDETGFLRQFKVVRWVPDGFYRPVRREEEAKEQHDDIYDKSKDKGRVGNVKRIQADSSYDDGSSDDEGDLESEAVPAILLEMVDSAKSNFPRSYSIMEHRKAHPRWGEYEKLFLEVMREGAIVQKSTIQQFSETRADIDFDILNDTTIVFATAMGAGTYQVRRYFPAQLVIIDEAGQCTEPMSAVPMCLRTMRQFIIVGDHIQLPPLNTHQIPILGTSLLEKLAGFRNKAVEAKKKKDRKEQGEAVEEKIKMSLESSGNRKRGPAEHEEEIFYRYHGICEAGDHGHDDNKASADPLGIKWAMLKLNYRSRAGIVNLISKHFYSGFLQATRPDNPEEDIFNKYFNERPKKASASYPPAILWQDVPRESEDQNQQTSSKYNRSSVHHIIDILTMLEALSPDVKGEDVAVISMYSAQVSLLRRAVAKFLRGSMKNVDIGTVESFQGMERKYVILDLVRSNKDRVIGFLHDVRRLNVAISRGTEKVIIVGDKVMFGRSFFYRGRKNERIYHLVNQILSVRNAVSPARPQDKYDRNIMELR